MRFAEVTHGGGLAQAAGRYGGEASEWLDLSTGINPVPVALPVIPASAWARLPDTTLSEAAIAAAARFYGSPHGVRPLPVPGTQAVIQCLPALAEGGGAAILGPTYGEYRAVLGNAGIEVDEIADLKAVGDRHRLVVVVNPNNPDGRVTARDELLALARRLAARDGLLVVDEAFADADPAESLAAEAGKQPGLLVFRSFGKFFGLAGLRLGFALAPDDLRAIIAHRLGPWAVSGPALAIAAAVMKNEETLAVVRSAIHARHAATHAVLAGAGLRIAGGTSLFFLVGHEKAQALHAFLCRRHILVRAFDYAPEWLRFGLTADEQGAQRLAAALAGFAASA